MRNSLKIWTLLAFISLCFILIGQSLADRRGMIWGMTISLGINGAIFFYGYQRLLHIFPVHLVQGQDAWGLLPLVEKLAQKFQIATPEVYLVALKVPITWSAGNTQKNSKIILSETLLREFPADQVASCISFELARIKRHDTLAIGMAVGLSSFLSWPYRKLKASAFMRLGEFVEAALKPLAFLTARVAVSHQDIFAADKLTVQVTGQPELWAQTIWNLTYYTQKKSLRIIEDNEAIAFVINPLTKPFLNSYFSSHPLLKERLRRLVGRYPL